MATRQADRTDFRLEWCDDERAVDHDCDADFAMTLRASTGSLNRVELEGRQLPAARACKWTMSLVQEVCLANPEPA